MRNGIEFVVTGDYALFSDPITRVGGEKFSYPIPTYQAVKGLVESVYWKPCLVWVIDEVRVMKPIRTQSKGVRPIAMNGGNSLSYYTYLRDVAYQVRAHFVFNEHRPDLAGDHNEHKHHNIAKRMVEKGGRRDVFLGTRECCAYVEPCAYGEGAGHYDGTGIRGFGVQFHGFNYPGETDGSEFAVRLWDAEMVDGRIVYPPPDRCVMVKRIRTAAPKRFTPGVNYRIFDERGDEA